MEEKTNQKTHNENHKEMKKYWHLTITTIISGIIMYLVMYAMIDNLGSFYLNFNMFYMTLMMVAPMVIIMIAGMTSMYPNKKLNYLLIITSAAIFFLSWGFIRWQFPLGDVQFLRSMIPHHSGAILMCRESEISDPEIIKLCSQIIKSQQDEIGQMKLILENKQ